MKITNLIASSLTFGIIATALVPGCAVDATDDQLEELELVDDAEEALTAPADCTGFECKVLGVASQGSSFRVTCEHDKNEHTVMRFCYSAEGECRYKNVETGQTVCLEDEPDGRSGYWQQTQCLDDPCCVPCPDEDAAAAIVE